jgi:hypothetical protein
MRTKSLVTCLVGLVLLFALSSSAAEMRKWTRKNGKEFEAEFVKVEKDSEGHNIAALRKPDGTEMTVRIPNISEEDRKYIRQHTNLGNHEGGGAPEKDGRFNAISSDVLRQSFHPHGNVNDYAGILSPAERGSLESRVLQLRQKTTAQFAVVILKSLKGSEIDDFTNKLFNQWGVGEKGKNNGVMLLVAIEDRKARIEVGYGLEPILPDTLAGRVLAEVLFPAFRQHRYAEGLTQAVARVAQIIERGKPASAEDKQKRNKT